MSREDARGRIGQETGVLVSTPAEHYNAPHLAKNAANFTALTPLVLLRRAAAVYPDKLAVIHGTTRFSYRELYCRCNTSGVSAVKFAAFFARCGAS